MKKRTKLTALELVEVISEASRESKLSEELFTGIDKELKLFADFFCITKSQSFVLANLFALACEMEIVEVSDFTKYFDCSPVKMLKYLDDLKLLADKGICKKKGKKLRFDLSYVKEGYELTQKTYKSIINNKIETEEDAPVFKDIIDLLENIYSLASEREGEVINSIELLLLTEKTINENQHFNILKTLKEYKVNPYDAFLFMYLCWKVLTGNETAHLETTIDEIFENAKDKVRYIQKILSNENDLIKRGLIETGECEFSSDVVIKLTEQGKDLLRKEDIKIVVKQKQNVNMNVLSPDKLPFKQLIYNEKEQKQIQMLSQILQEENLLMMQKRLLNKSMPAGVAVLLYGAPGTGKTESVYQIARATNRDIMMVNISELKSMWFGQSEKIIKKIFIDYQELVKTTERCPILLFNEADAIISKRKELGFSNVSQTENAIQNIILDEMERFSGIIFATTNLAKNLDGAFERRFLFKIEFFKPDLAKRTAIWKLKLNLPDEQHYELLAEKFNFSGAQIENIARKCELNDIINNKQPEIDDIIAYCHDEMINKDLQKVRVGFI
jgi:SpoVK/Ycf46/Vps4 family AAA+-type ATPase